MLKKNLRFKAVTFILILYFNTMKFSLGDKVLLLHSGEKAEVVELISEEMVMVDVGGLSFPVFTDQIDFPYYQSFMPNQSKLTGKPVPGENIPQEKHSPRSDKDQGVWLSLLPVYRQENGEDIVHILKLHLVNESPCDYIFHYQVWVKKELFLELKSPLLSHTHFYLHDLQFEQLNDNPRFEFDFSLLNPDPRHVGSIHKVIRPRAEKIFRKLGELKNNNQATFSFSVLSKFPEVEILEPVKHLDKLLRHSSQIISPMRITQSSLPQYEIDLHIEKLLENWQGMSNFEILTLQLQEFSRYLDLAIGHRQSSLIVIHGVGKGRLRDEIHEILKNIPEVRNFINEYDVRYGSGATKINFNYGKLPKG